MMIIACVDEKNGLMFNHRRQSRDLAVCRDILRECRGKKLYMSVYSARLFEEVRGAEETTRAVGIEETTRAVGTEETMRAVGTEEATRAVGTEETMRAVGTEEITRAEGSEEAMKVRGTEENAEKNGTEIVLSEEILSLAGDEDICFIEDTAITGFEEQIREVILYKWNRRYPADRYFTLDLSDGTWELLRTEEFKGSSHERITKEVYKREK